MMFMRKWGPEFFFSKPPVAVLGDIHSNLEALTAVLADIRRQGIRSMVCTGDVVGYGANPLQCVDILREADCPVVQGNHDFFASTDHSLDEFTPNARHSILWTREQLTESARTYLAGLPQTKNLNGFSLVHSSLDYPESWRYLMRPHDAEASFLIQKSPLVFAGHTHVPMAFYWQKDLPVQGGVFKKIHLTPSRKWFVNPGSTGQPRDCDPRASYAVYDPERRVVVVCRVEYDIVEAQRKIRESGLPERNAERLAIGR
jgi:predicted phosphodiesterase